MLCPSLYPDSTACKCNVNEAYIMLGNAYATGMLPAGFETAAMRCGHLLHQTAEGPTHSEPVLPYLGSSAAKTAD